MVFRKFQKTLVATVLFIWIASFAQAQYNVDSLFAGLDTLQSDSSKIKAMNAIAYRNTRRDIAIAEIFVDSALRLSKSLNDDYLISLSYMVRGFVLQNKSELDKALVLYDSSLVLARKRGDTAAMASIYNNIGNTYRIKGEYGMALKYLYESVGFCRNDTSCFVSKLGNIASIHYAQGEFEKAIKIFLEISVVFKKKKNSRHLLSTYSNLAECYRQIKSYEEAMDYATKVLELSIGEGDIRTQAMAYSRIGNINVTLNKDSEARTNFNKSIEISEKTNYYSGLVQSYASLAKLDIKYKNYKSAIKNANKNLKYAMELGALLQLERSYILLSEIYENTGNYDKAYEYLILKNTISDSIYREQEQNKMSELQTKYETKEKEQKIALLEKDKLIKQTEIEKNAQQQNWLIGFFMAILIVAVVMFYYYKKTKAAKSKIETLQREIHHRVKNNLSINKRMVQIAEEKTEDPESSKTLAQLSNRISSMAQIHEQLYKKKDMTNVDFRKYIEDLNTNIASSFNIVKPEIDQKIESNIHIGFDKAVPLGLMVNELLTNAYKYACNTSKEAKILLWVTKEADNIRIKIADNGNGFPDGFNPDKISSYGLKLVNGLTQQLNGTIKFFNSGGANIEIKVPI